MTPALTTLAAQHAHYAAVRMRLRGPMRLQFVPVPPRPVCAPPPVFQTDEERIRCALELLRDRRPSLHLIRRTVADVCGLTVAELAGTPGSRRRCQERAIALALSRCLLSERVSLAKIGGAFAGRDHSTVWYAYQKHRALVERVAQSLTPEPTT